jgi:Ner family transcriptional regulator
MAARTQSFSGWHPADVKAAIQKRGFSLTALALLNGYSEAYLRMTLQRPMPRGEAIIARVLGVPAKLIWPDRYDANGRPRSTRRSRRLRRAA